MLKSLINSDVFKKFRSLLFILFCIISVQSFSQKKYEDFAEKYSGMGALSEVIMSNKCIIRENFNLFFESNVKKSEKDRTLIWYKLVFHQPCFISFTVIPNDETDRYELEIYKVKNNVKICNTVLNEVFDRVDSLSKTVTYTDNFQSQSFRGSLFNTRQINVELDEAVFILVNNLEGPDLGHVIDLQTCDYSYVLKVNKDKLEDGGTKEDRSNLSNPELRLLSVERKLCEQNDDQKLGYSSFLGDKMSTKNFDKKSLDSANIAQAKAIRSFDSLAGKPLADLTPRKVPMRNEKKDSIKPPEIKKSIFFPQIFTFLDSVKVDTSKKNPVKLTPYRVKDSIMDFILKKPLKTNPNDNTNNKNKKIEPKTKRNLLNVYFTVIDASTKRAISYPELKFNKKGNIKKPNLIYIDSLCSYSCSFLNSNKWVLKCEVFGFMPYEEYFDSEKCIDVGDDDYCYLIPIRPYKKGDKLALPDVFFFPNSTKLKKESFETLDQLVTYLEYNPASIRVNGHTQGNKKISNNSSKVDADLRFKGSAKKLSKKRADKVCEYIINKGISPKRISSKGFAGRKPIVKEPKTRSDREKNMRVEIEIVELNSDSLLNK